ncbi:hypothetical protein [Leeuwenhoekiella sp. ZYFB001]|uniref:hypothetical protein n=1 Tax=Leeuwenhoekiella sp. ZYFB001 TaxID=2719912 RepID=UPI001430BE60|nr:hypothetical protein [Leeuwenhoekiella sp. ZYFB001]
MPKIVFSILILFCLTATAQQKYMDYNNQLISERDLEQHYKGRNYFAIETTIPNVTKLILRTQEDTLQQVENLYAHLEEITGQTLERDKMIAIIYYPGLDTCNDRGSINFGTRKLWYKEMERKLNRIADINTVYIYKNDEGLKKWRKANWTEDKNQIIERLFFKYHYPCGSFTVVHPSGHYKSGLGEYSKSWVWKLTEDLVQAH